MYVKCLTNYSTTGTCCITIDLEFKTEAWNCRFFNENYLPVLDFSCQLKDDTLWNLQTIRSLFLGFYVVLNFSRD